MLTKHVQINDDTTPHKQDGPYYMLQELIHIISVLHAMILWNAELKPKSKNADGTAKEDYHQIHQKNYNHNQCKQMLKLLNKNSKGHIHWISISIRT